MQARLVIFILQYLYQVALMLFLLQVPQENIMDNQYMQPLLILVLPEQKHILADLFKQT